MLMSCLLEIPFLQTYCKLEHKLMTLLEVNYLNLICIRAYDMSNADLF
jgi:hypothetical protein